MVLGENDDSPELLERSFTRRTLIEVFDCVERRTLAKNQRLGIANQKGHAEFRDAVLFELDRRSQVQELGHRPVGHPPENPIVELLRIRSTIRQLHKEGLKPT